MNLDASLSTSKESGDIEGEENMSIEERYSLVLKHFVVGIHHLFNFVGIQATGAFLFLIQNLTMFT